MSGIRISVKEMCLKPVIYNRTLNMSYGLLVILAYVHLEIHCRE